MESQSEKYTFAELESIDSFGQLINFVNSLEVKTKGKKFIGGMFSDKNGMVGRVTVAELNDLIFKITDILEEQKKP